VILVVAGITCGLWGVVLITRGEGSTNIGPTPTPIFVVITPSATLESAPPATQSPGGGNPFPPTMTPITLNPTTIPTSGPAIPIILGATIIVSGTGGDGLSVRQGPGVDYPYLFVAEDGERFLVQDGPREASGYTWWYIVDPNDPNRFGWAVDIFMLVSQ
jgi:hypothetical protein